LVDQSLLGILVCPETKQPLHVADAALLERLNAAVRKGGVTNRGGSAVATPLEAGSLLYPVRDDIPIMLIDESIPLPPKP
jgi:uncharacterized protein YbaR (Trm112 family)